MYCVYLYLGKKSVHKIGSYTTQNPLFLVQTSLTGESSGIK